MSMHPSLRSKHSQWNCCANVGARVQEMEETRAETIATQTTCTLKIFVRFETTSKQAVSKEELKG